MPRFMGFVRMAEGVGPPPQSLFDAMDKFIGERAANGVFLDGGGLYGTEDAVNYVVRQGRGDPRRRAVRGSEGGRRRLGHHGVREPEEAATGQRPSPVHPKHRAEVTGSPPCVRSRPVPRRPARDVGPADPSPSSMGSWIRDCDRAHYAGGGVGSDPPR